MPYCTKVQYAAALAFCLGSGKREEATSKIAYLFALGASLFFSEVAIAYYREAAEDRMRDTGCDMPRTRFKIL